MGRQRAYFNICKLNEHASRIVRCFEICVQTLVSSLPQRKPRESFFVDSFSPNCAIYQAVRNTQASAAASGWRRLSYDEWRSRNLGKREPVHGCLEMFVQQVSVRWPTAAGGVLGSQDQQVLCPPTFMTRNNASTLLGALERTVPPLQWSELQKLAKNTKVLCVSMVADLDGANGRLKLQYAAWAREHNTKISQEGGETGFIAIIDVFCLAHVLHRVFESTFKLVDLVPKLHATAFIFNQPKIYSSMLLALERVVRDDFQRGLHRGVRPTSTFRQHNLAVVDATLLRERYTRARTELESPAADADLDSLVSALMEFFGNDWRQNFLIHDCWGSCCAGGSFETAVQRAKALLMEVLFRHLGERLPSATRWYTVAPSMSRQAFGMLFHSVLPRVRVAAAEGARPVAAGAGAPDQNSFAELCTKRSQMSFEFLSDPETHVSLPLALVVSEPLAAMQARLEMLDQCGHSLTELLQKPGMLSICQDHLCAFVPNERPVRAHGHELSRGAGRLAMLLRHFQGARDISDVLEKAQIYSTQISAQVWARIEAPSAVSL